MALGQQQPVVTGVLHQPAARLHQPLLQAGKRPVADSLRQFSFHGIQRISKWARIAELGLKIYRRLMKRVLERDGWRCQKCGSLENLQVHHEIKRSQRGNDSLENLVTLFAYCHMAAHGQLFYSVRAARVCNKPKPRVK